MAPRFSPDAPRVPPNAPKFSSGAPKFLSNAPKFPPSAPKLSPDALEFPPVVTKARPLAAKMPQNVPKRGKTPAARREWAKGDRWLNIHPHPDLLKGRLDMTTSCHYHEYIRNATFSNHAACLQLHP